MLNPAQLFTTGELAIWRNVTSWMDLADPNDPDSESDWITLPGPAEWWSTYTDREIADMGFDTPAKNKGYKMAYDLAMSAEYERPEFQMVVHSDHELRIEMPEKRVRVRASGGIVPENVIVLE